MAVGSAQSSVSPLQFWIQRIGDRMVEAADVVRDNSYRLAWDLPPPGSDIADWAISRIRDILSQGYVKAFYIGLTSRLRERWFGSGRMVGHHVKWQQMFIVGASDHADEIGNAETSVISQFRRYGPRGVFVSHPAWSLARLVCPEIVHLGGSIRSPDDFRVVKTKRKATTTVRPTTGDRQHDKRRPSDDIKTAKASVGRPVRRQDYKRRPSDDERRRSRRQETTV